MSVEYAESSSRPFTVVERSLAYAPDAIRQAINRKRTRDGLQPYRRMVVAAPTIEVDAVVRATATVALARLRKHMKAG